MEDEHTEKDEEATALAITVLFGNSFAQKADPGLLSALRRSPEAVGSLLSTSWRMSGSDQSDEPKLGPLLAARDQEPRDTQADTLEDHSIE